MKHWEITAALVAMLALVYLACQGTADMKPLPEPEKAKIISTPEPKEVEPERTEEEVPPEPVQETKIEKAKEAAPKEEKKREVSFAEGAFPPTVSDTEYHKGAWYKDDCLRCHETGVEDATRVRHRDMPKILLTAKCRSCHVLIAGQPPRPRKKTEEEKRYAEFAFPPMIPASVSHQEAWLKDNCLLCHESGVRGAPVVKHKDMPKILLEAKCRSCHVQVRSPSVPGR